MASWVDLRQALENGRGHERAFNCPMHDDKHASAYVNPDKGVWYCFVCQKGGKTQAGRHDTEYIKAMDPDEPIPVLPMAALATTNAWSGYGDYWANRFGVEAASLYQTGVDPVTGMPTVPILSNDGELLHGFVFRNTSDEGPKYIYPRAVPVSRLLFGIHLAQRDQADTILLVEGASDVMSLSRWRSPGCVAAGVYGAGIKRPQAEHIAAMQPRQVIVAMDADPAGRAANDRSLLVLQAAGIAAAALDWAEFGVSDPGELDADPWPGIAAAVNTTA